MRVLYTGTRHGDYPAIAVLRSLGWLWRTASTAGVKKDEILIVHGACPAGVDSMVGQAAPAKGFTVEPHPAVWSDCDPGFIDPINKVQPCTPKHRAYRKGGGQYCPTAGLRRNQLMVSLGVDVCIAHPQGPSPGTRDAMARCVAEKIPVFEFDHAGNLVVRRAQWHVVPSSN